MFVSIASMLLGSFAAIGQRNIKRLMAYSSIGHMGFALIGLAAGTSEGVQGVLVYMAIYVTMTLGTFAVILSMRRSGGMVESIDQLAGLARTHPTMAFFLAMLLFSMAGIPPLAGFFAKFYVFLAAIKAGLYVLAVIGVLASVVGAYYYLAIIKTMYFDEPAEGFYGMPGELKVVLWVCGAVQHPVLPLSGTAGRRSERCRPFAVLMQLHSAAAVAGYRLAAHETLESTNAEALRLARGGERGPLWIVARQQTAGRGRRGSEWISPPGNLHATLLLVDPAPAECAPELSFVAALALHDAIVELAPSLRSDLSLKWPNDMLHGGGKLAGILIEGERPARELAVAIGIGVNCRHHPGQTSYPATDLAAVGADISAESLFATLSAAMVRRLAPMASRRRV